MDINTKRKKLLIIVSVLVVIAITVVVAITQSTKWSHLSFEAVIQETAIQPDGEVRLIVKRTTEVYSDPLGSLQIDENTALIGNDGEAIPIDELPFYYLTVYEIKLLHTN